MSDDPEFWLRGPIAGIPALLQPVAHALLQARGEVRDIMYDFPDGRLWDSPSGLASPGFHLQHLSGVLDRLFTYARKEALTPEQLRSLASEGSPGSSCRELLARFDARVEQALEQLRTTREDSLLEPREVGRKKLPSNLIGLLFHAAEHTQRHTGQLLVTARMITLR